MLVPGHVVSLYVATSGLPGAGLGSDEKEVILLVYVIIDVQTTKIVGIKQYLVRPVGQVFGKDSTTIQNAILPSSPSEEPQVPADLPISETLLQKAGKPLNEVLEQFDAYTRSLSLDPNSSNFHIVTDGQLPLRQCLHPEASAKDINLPAYYFRFSDLRKEYVRFKGGDLSRALIPLSDVTKLQNMPSLPPPPQSISEMMTELDLTPYQENDFYIKESFDMVQIIQTLLAAGHKFDGIETVDLTLEPGICSIDDEIDGTCIVRARGLPWQSSDQDIAKFFRGLNVAKGGVALCLSPQGRRNGEALIRFISQEHRDMALKRHKHHIGPRYIEVYRASGEDFLAVAGGASNEAQTFLSKGAQVIIRMRGLPYDCTSKQVLDFFSTGDNPCTVLDGADGVLFVKKPDGRATGDAFVLFPKEADASKALSRHRESIGQRYIELFRSTTAEVQQVLNRSMDPKTYEPLPPPLIAQLPPVQMPLLPQHVITSGTEKSCIRLRGLPYEAKVEHILHFLEEFSKHIIYQGVHLVYNAQGQFNGEAFIQMDSETAAFSSAQQKHHKYMMFGKKQRYIEVFQCSGDDMNMVLNGGFQAPASISKPPLLSPGMLPSPQQTQQPSLQSLSVPPPMNPITLSIPPPPSPALLAQQQAQFIAQQSLIARQQAAAAAAQQHQNEQFFLHNLNMLQHQQAGSSHSSSGSGQMTASHLQQASQAGQMSHVGAGMQPQMAPQFFYLPRPMFQQHAGGFPFGMIPQFTMAPHPGMAHQGHPSPSYPQSATIPTTSYASTITTPIMSANSVKRTYESAFRSDQLSMSAPKRAAYGTVPGVGSSAGTVGSVPSAAAFYANLYHHPPM